MEWERLEPELLRNLALDMPKRIAELSMTPICFLTTFVISGKHLNTFMGTQKPRWCY